MALGIGTHLAVREGATLLRPALRLGWGPGSGHTRSGAEDLTGCTEHCTIPEVTLPKDV